MTSNDYLRIEEFEERVRKLRSEHLVDALDVAAYADVKACSAVTVVLMPIGWANCLLSFGVCC